MVAGEDGGLGEVYELETPSLSLSRRMPMK